MPSFSFFKEKRTKRSFFGQLLSPKQSRRLLGLAELLEMPFQRNLRFAPFFQRKKGKDKT
jgi:hypothetical protein